MSKKDNIWEDYTGYVKQTEPCKSEKYKAWQTGIGLQAVDGLKTSEYLYKTAEQNINGNISINEAEDLIQKYYESKDVNTEDSDKEEADKVSIRIAKILSEKTFSFSVLEYLNIHKRLFDGLYKFAGQIRQSNISKKEWVLDGNSVLYSGFDMIQRTLEYDFEQERNFDYKGLSAEEIIKHFSRFIANIWQVHAFREGNTRTTAVFAIKYLTQMGFNLNNKAFSENSWYFRNALVRANYSDVLNNIHMDTEYLEKFFRNILLGEHNELKNRYLHIKAENLPINLPINKTSSAVLRILQEHPDYIYDQIAQQLGKTRETVRVNIRILEQRGFISRRGSRKTGHWEILKTK